jgi:transcriptional regulator with XRE-family HTH domain
MSAAVTKMDEMGPRAGSSSETVGQRLKRLRLERGLSQRELAAPGVSYAYISRIEAGTRQPSVKALRRLAAKLQVTPEYLETGSDLDPAEARELRLADAELGLRLGDPKAAETAIAELLEEAVRAGDTANASRARIALAFVRYENGDHSVAARLFEEALASERPPATERLDVYVTLARAYDFAGAPERGVELLEHCIAEVRATDPYDVAVEVRYATTLSYLLSDAGDLDRAAEVLKEALERARDAADDPYMRVRLYWSLARLSEMQGRSSAALHHIRRAMALLEATDDTIHLARAHLGCAVIMTSQGNADAALAQLERAEQLLGVTISGDDLGRLKTERARALVVLGRAGEAAVLAREAVAAFDRRNEPELGSAYAALADALALQGDGGADDAYARAVDLLAEQRRWREAVAAAQSWAKLLRKAGREAEALDVLERASELGLRLAPATTRER